jgi:UDP-N-acetylglucosamine 1-carboxyvinyltransferase
MEVDIVVGIDKVVIKRKENIKAVDIQTLPYPGFATDLQQPITALLSQAYGVSNIKETIYPERFKQCIELHRMGAEIQVTPPSCAITGPTPLYGDEVRATDLRCGASLVVAGLIAEGITTITDIEHIERGYENIDGKLKELGANIWREEVEEK